MLKKVLFAAVATGLVAAIALPVPFTRAEAGKMRCKQAAKMKFPGDMKARHSYRKACKAHMKGPQKA